MKGIGAKTRLAFLPFALLAVGFVIGYSFLYWLFYLELGVIPLKQEIMHFWAPIGVALLLVIVFIRPRIHALKLDRNDGKARTMYYVFGTIVLCMPAVFAAKYMDSATGKLTELDSITDISRRPETRYYKAGSYVLFRDKIGVEGVMSYSGKRNQYLDFDLYVAMPFAAYLGDTLGTPAAFLSKHYQKQVSSDLSDEERQSEWKKFWNESLKQFDNEPVKFIYLERIANTEARDHLRDAARKSGLYKGNRVPLILHPVNDPFEERNGNRLIIVFLSLGIGLAVWFIMVIIPGIHPDKAMRVSPIGARSGMAQLVKGLQFLKPEKGFAVTPLLLMANTLLFVVMVFKGLGFITFSTSGLVAFGAVYEPALAKGQWWRLVTGMFLHGGFMHLVMNMVSLYLAGLFLESTIGSKKFIVGYLLSGIIAGLVSLWWHDKPVVAVGASGAIFGLYGILLALIIFKVFSAGMNKVLLVLLACTAGYSLLMGFLSKGIDNSAHLGGLLTGFLTGFFFLPSLRNQQDMPGELRV
jgi:membrane associated rhomboid family serine protease